MTEGDQALLDMGMGLYNANPSRRTSGSNWHHLPVHRGRTEPGM